MKTSASPGIAPTLPADVTALPSAPPELEKTVSLPLPPKNHIYIPIPEDIPNRSITAPGVHSLCRVKNGDFIDEVDAALSEVVQAVTRLGKKGSLKIKIEVQPNGQGRVAIDTDVVCSPPKEKRHPYPLFAFNGQLVNRDPDQMEMELKTTPHPNVVPLRTVTPPDQSTPLRTVVGA